MKKNEILLWAVAIICGILAVISIPNTTKLKSVNAQIKQTQLKKKEVATQTAVNSPYSNEFDLKSAEQHAEKRDRQRAGRPALEEGLPSKPKKASSRTGQEIDERTGSAEH